MLLDALGQIELLLCARNTPPERNEDEGYLIYPVLGVWLRYPVIFAPQEDEWVGMSMWFPRSNLEGIEDLNGLCGEISRRLKRETCLKFHLEAGFRMHSHTSPDTLSQDLDQFVEDCDRVFPYLAQVIKTKKWDAKHVIPSLKLAAWVAPPTSN